jgi:hypothetical protein
MCRLFLNKTLRVEYYGIVLWRKSEAGVIYEPESKMAEILIPEGYGNFILSAVFSGSVQKVMVDQAETIDFSLSGPGFIQNSDYSPACHCLPSL